MQGIFTSHQSTHLPPSSIGLVSLLPPIGLSRTSAKEWFLELKTQEIPLKLLLMLLLTLIGNGEGKTIQQDNIIRPSSLISVPEIPINSICGQIIISWNENLRLQSWSIHFYTPPFRLPSCGYPSFVACPLKDFCRFPCKRFFLLFLVIVGEIGKRAVNRTIHIHLFCRSVIILSFSHLHCRAES